MNPYQQFSEERKRKYQELISKEFERLMPWIEEQDVLKSSYITNNTERTNLRKFDRKMTAHDVLGKSRNREIVAVRFIIMKYLYDNVYRCSKKDISRFFGKDHSCVIHAIKTVDNMVHVKDKLYCSLLNSFQDYGNN